MIQGHLEAGEEIAAAAIREAKEEAGITILPQDLCFKAVCHDQTELPYIQFIFTCQRWSGEITNTEPEYCQELKWFETDKLPPNIISKIKTFIKLPENIKLFEI